MIWSKLCALFTLALKREVPGLHLRIRRRKMKPLFSFILLATLLLVLAINAAAQDSTGPMAPPPKFEVKRIPTEPHPGPPPVPEEVII